MITQTPKLRLLLPLLSTLLLAPACETDGYDDIFDLADHEASELDPSHAIPLELAPGDALPDAQLVSVDERKGRVSFDGAWDQSDPDDTGKRCKTVSFPAFSDLTKIRAQVAIDHASSNVNREATTVWVENVTLSSIDVCVRETADANDHHLDGMNVGYRVYNYQTVDAALAVTGSTTGSAVADALAPTCTTIDFASADQGANARSFSVKPRLQVSLGHTDSTHHDAITVWVENVSTSSFTACVQELGHGDNGPGNSHYDYVIDWIAYEGGDEPYDGTSGIFAQPSSFTGRQCTDISYGLDLDFPPLIFATVDHRNNNEADDDAMTVWIETIDTNSDTFELCYQELSPSNDSHTEKMKISWAALVF